jgi:methylthioribulose-1-phosphate dehydratase
VLLIGSHDSEPTKTEVGHGASCRSYIEGIAGRNEDDGEAIALGIGRQAPILERPREWLTLWVGTLHPRMVPDTDFLDSAAEALCATARWCYSRGWVPATSGNFSVRVGSRILITPSGLDKGILTRADLIEVDGEGSVVNGSGKPSAETGLHLVLYRARPGAGAILHVHTIWNTLLSARFALQGHLSLEGYEILKGLSGVSTHDHVESVPILNNHQNYAELCRDLAGALDAYPHAHGVLLSRHGLYTWGQSVAEARRHLEALEFLFEVEGRRLTAGDSLTPIPTAKT